MMRPAEFLVEQTLDDAVEMLAKRAAYRRAHLPTVAEKRALSASDFLSSLGTAARDNPILASLRTAATENPILAQSALGGLAGAGLGGAGTALGNIGKPKEERRSAGRAALTGGLAGLGVGAGVGLAREGLAGVTAGRAARVPTAPGRFTEGGQTYQIDPSVVQQRPGLNREVQELTNPEGINEHIGQGLAGAYRGIQSAVPFSSRAVPALMGLDLAAHGPWNWTRAQNAGGGVGRDVLRAGLNETPFGSVFDEKLRNQINTGRIPPSGGPQSPITVAGGRPGDSVIDAIVRQRGGGTRTLAGMIDRPVETVEQRRGQPDDQTITKGEQPSATKPPKVHTFNQQHRNDAMRAGSQVEGHAGRMIYRPFGAFTGMGEKLQQLGAGIGSYIPQQLKNWASGAASATATAAKKVPGATTAGNLIAGTASRGRQAFNATTGGNWRPTWRGSGSMARSGGARAALYLGMPALEYGFRTYGGALDRRRSMADIIRRGLGDTDAEGKPQTPYISVVPPTQGRQNGSR